MILDINKSPHINSYTYHAYSNAIMDTEKNTGDFKAELVIEEGKRGDWTGVSNDLKIIWDNNRCLYYADPFADNTESFIYRDCKEVDELIVKVVFFQQLNPDAIINLFVSKNPVSQCIAKSQNIVRFSNISKAGYTASQDEYNFELSLDRDKFAHYQWMKIKREENQICCQLSSNGMIWEDIFWAEMDLCKGERCMIGINTNFGDNHYYNLLFSNYIQLSYNNYLEIKLDYYNCCFKNSMPYYTNQFLDSRVLFYDEIEIANMKLHEYIEKMIKKNVYVELFLDEYYIPERASYRLSHYSHQNLVYGIEDDNFTIMGYNGQGKLSFGTISVSVFEKCRNGLENNRKMIKLIKYNLNDRPYLFDISFIKSQLMEYLQSVDSSKKMQYILPGGNAVYGLNIYREFLNNQDAMEELMDDPRITYVLKEHKEMMKKRIQYIYKRKYLLQTDFENFNNEIDEIIKLANALVMIVLKGKMTAISENSEKKIKEILTLLIEKEAKCYNELLDCINA